MTDRRMFLAGLVLGGSTGGVAGAMLASVSRDDGDNDGNEGSGNDSSAGDPSTVELAERVRKLTNERRDNEHGGLVPELSANSRLAEMASYHSRNMASNSYLGHVHPRGETLLERYTKYGLASNLKDDTRALVGSSAENIARLEVDGKGAAKLASMAVSSWASSSPDREWLLERAWSEHGVGVAFDDDVVYVTQNYL